MKTNNRFLLTAILALASAFIFSCSSPGGSGFSNSPSSGSSGGNEVSYEYCITALGCLPGPFTASTCGGQLSNSCPTNPTPPPTPNPNPSSNSNGGAIGVPAAPTGLRATASANTLQVTWNAVAGAVGYVLYVSADNFATYEYGLVSGTSYTESNVPSGTYYFVVTAYNSNYDESDISNVASVTITSGSTPPPTPPTPVPGNGFTSIADMKAWLASQPDNTPSTPYTIKLNVSDLGGSATANASVGRALRDNPTKYVILDLSGSTFTSIGANAFGTGNAGYGGQASEAAQTLVGVIIPNTVTTIGSSAFRGCAHLTSVTFAATSKVTSIGSYAFASCTSLTSIIVPNSVINIGGYAFGGCTSLTSATIGSSVISIEGSAFTGCTSLASVRFEGDAVGTPFASGAFINSTATNNLNTAYIAGGAGTYTRSGNNWTKQ